LALKILLSDPNQDWILKTREFFKDLNYQVEVSLNGKDTQLKLYRDRYFALLMNYSIQDHSAKQVLHFVKKNYPQLKVILYIEDPKLALESGDTDEELLKLGASEIMKMPFERSELHQKLEGQQDAISLLSNKPLKEGVSDEVEVDSPDEDYIAIKINEFFSSKAVLFDVFIRLRANRFVKILHAGDTFSKDRILNYKDKKGVEYLYFHQKDRKKFVQFNALIAKKMVANQLIATNTKVTQLKNVTSQYIDEVHCEGLKPQVVEQGKDICDTVFDLVEKDKDLFRFLKEFQTLDASAYSHSFLVTLYATSITKQFDWESAQTLQAMAMACLFHDIGKLSLPKDLLMKRPEDKEDNERELYQSHPILGFEMVSNNKMINNTVKQVILQHHETYDGTGFPYGIKGSKILMMANIVCLVDDFIHAMVRDKTSPVETVKKILLDKEISRRYHSSILENFIKIFVDPEKLAKDKLSKSTNTNTVSKKAS
jgi:HD-GYP domain-containing protein (c-di-GMP phosphodiesterase class II)